MSYTFSGVTTNASSTTTVTASFNIGAGVSPFVVVGVQQQTGHASPTMTIGSGTPISMNLDFINTDNQEVFFSCLATGLSGTQTVSLTAAGSAFETVGFSLWYFPSLMVLSHTAGIASGTTLTIPVNVGDSLFVTGHDAGTAYNYSGSSAAPTGDRPITGAANNPESADWVITSSNASFSVVSSAGAATAAVTYAAPVAPSFKTIGIGGSNW